MLSKITKPTDEKIHYNDDDISIINQYDYRAKYAGVAFQAYNLTQHLNALESEYFSIFFKIYVKSLIKYQFILICCRIYNINSCKTKNLII